MITDSFRRTFGLLNYAFQIKPNGIIRPIGMSPLVNIHNETAKVLATSLSNGT